MEENDGFANFLTAASNAYTQRRLSENNATLRYDSKIQTNRMREIKKQIKENKQPATTHVLSAAEIAGAKAVRTLEVLKLANPTDENIAGELEKAIEEVEQLDELKPHQQTEQTTDQKENQEATPNNTKETPTGGISKIANKLKPKKAA